jgi:hypothetical protein
MENTTNQLIATNHAPQASARSDRPKTYSSTTRETIPTPLTKILACSEAQAHQIMIDRRSVFASNTLKDLMEVQLVTKVTLAIELMVKTGLDAPKNIAVLSARKLPHGGILYEFKSTTSTAWISSPANQRAFLDHFGPKVIVKNCLYHLIVENVPISFDPLSTIALSEIERKSGLTNNSITRAKYIKPIAR